MSWVSFFIFFFSRLPDFAEHFAAEVFLTRFAVADHTAAGAEHRDPQTLQDRSQVASLAIHTSSRFADAFDMSNHAFAVGPVFEFDAKFLDGRSSTSAKSQI